MKEELNNTIIGERDHDSDFFLPTSDDKVYLDEPTDEETKNGIYGLLVDAIQNSWDKIDRYNSYIATVNEEDPSNTIVLQTLQEILDGELINVSRLMGLLTHVDESTADNLAVDTSIENETKI